MKGYYKMPEATAVCTDKNGWLHSSDQGIKDADGNFKVTGRVKDLIIRGGENISPKEVEDFLYTIPGVKDESLTEVFLENAKGYLKEAGELLDLTPIQTAFFAIILDRL